MYYRKLKQLFYKPTPIESINTSDLHAIFSTIHASTSSRIRREIAYLAAINKLPTGNRPQFSLSKTHCPLCNDLSSLETPTHIFVDCPASRTLRNHIKNKMGTSTLTNQEIIYHQNLQEKTHHEIITIYKRAVWLTRLKVKQNKLDKNANTKDTMIRIYNNILRMEHKIHSILQPSNK